MLLFLYYTPLHNIYIYFHALSGFATSLNNSYSNVITSPCNKDATKCTLKNVFYLVTALGLISRGSIRTIIIQNLKQKRTWYKQKTKLKYMKFYNCLVRDFIFWNRCTMSSLSIQQAISFSIYIAKQKFIHWSSI